MIVRFNMGRQRLGVARGGLAEISHTIPRLTSHNPISPERGININSA